MAEIERLLLRAEAAAMLRVGVRTVRRWGASGRLDERHLSPTVVRVTEASVLRLIQAESRATSSRPGVAALSDDRLFYSWPELLAAALG